MHGARLFIADVEKGQTLFHIHNVQENSAECSSDLL